jgi:two-component sensor histidine kinase
MGLGQALPVTATVDDILVTGHLETRPRRRPDHEAENRALNDLALLMVEQPSELYQRFAHLAMDLCKAGSAGISLLETRASGDVIFRWKALAGALSPHVGGHTPRDFSPCGICLDQGETILLSWPARRFDYLGAVGVSIAEGLIVPLYSYERKALGTIWIISHDAERRFDAEDARIMEALAHFLALALEKDRLIRQKELLLRELQHRGKNTAQMIASLLSLQRRKSGPAGRKALDEASTRIKMITRVQSESFAEDATSTGGLPVVVRGMCDDVAEMFEAQGIEFDIDVEALATSPAKVLPICLIINELVTNAVKHAFPNFSAGRIAIQLRRHGPDELLLRITDDGVPFPGNFQELKARSLGLQLMEGLVEHLGGRLVYPRASDKSFTVLIPG